MYETARFFTVTGTRIGSTHRIEPRQDELAAVHREYLSQDERAHPAKSGPSSEQAETQGATAAAGANRSLPDDALLQKAREAKNGDKFSRLWDGDTSGYDSHSEADMALCSMLAFWTGGDARRVDRLFRDSELLRPKWDEQHFADGSTYGEKTIRRAIAHVDEFYEPADSEVAATDGERTPSRDETADSAGSSAETAAMPSDSGQADEATTADCSGDTESRVDALERKVDRLESELATEQRRRRDLESRVASIESALKAVGDETADDAATSGLDRLRTLLQ
jgi:primase-polymerase (primpol)-like protein